MHNLQLLPKPSDVALVEPYVTAVAGLLSPSTGIIDSHACVTVMQHCMQAQHRLPRLMTSLTADAEDAGATLSVNSRVVSGNVQGGMQGGLPLEKEYIVHRAATGPVKQLFVQDVGSGTITGVTCRHVVNAAGLGAKQLASSLDGLPRSTVPKQYLAKGTYFSVQGVLMPQHYNFNHDRSKRPL